MKSIKARSVFISGGTGSIGSALVKIFLADEAVAKVTVFSRDEMKQWQLEEQFPSPKLRCVLGDIRDYERVLEMMQGHEVVIHAAALKQVSRGESNPSEFTKTNVLGTQNMIAAARHHRPECFLFLSTDKAVNPEGNYGAGKLSAERMVMKAGEMNEVTRYVSLRLGNVMHTRGTVVPKFLATPASGFFTISHPESTRFHLSLRDAIGHVLFAIENGLGGEVIVPKLPAFVLQDLVNAIDPDREIQVVGLAKGEKKHEFLLSENELTKTLETDHYFIVTPDDHESCRYRFAAHYGAFPGKPELTYSSASVRKLTVPELKSQVYRLKPESLAKKTRASQPDPGP